MVNYRRVKLKGGTYFFTVTLRNRQCNLLTKHINELRVAVKHTFKLHPFQIIAMVVLPEHLHAIWQLPQDDDNYSLRWSIIKRHFTHQLIQKGYQFKRAKDRTSHLWQRRFWEHTISDERDLQHHIDYIHYNPVKHQLVTQVKDWPYSSFHLYCRRGWLENNWGDCGTNADFNGARE